jgi:hypothetical protein
MSQPISRFKIALAVVLVVVLVSAATFVQAILAGLALPFFGDSAGTSSAFAASDLLSRLVVVVVAAWGGTALARSAASSIAVVSASILGVAGIMLMVASREPSTWYNYLGLLVLVGGTLLGGMLWRRKGAAGARAAT